MSNTKPMYESNIDISLWTKQSKLPQNCPFWDFFRELHCKKTKFSSREWRKGGKVMMPLLYLHLKGPRIIVGVHFRIPRIMLFFFRHQTLPQISYPLFQTQFEFWINYLLIRDVGRFTAELLKMFEPPYARNQNSSYLLC